MSIARSKMEEHLFGGPGAQRFTQDSPIMPEVWIKFGEEPGKRHDLILTPFRDYTPAKLATVLRERLAGEAKKKARVAYNDTCVVASLTFAELLTMLPLSSWWKTHASRPSDAKWLRSIVGLIAAGSDKADGLLRAAKAAAKGAPAALWSVNRNRTARTQLWRSSPAIKADAAIRLFDITCAELTWAVVDSGIDALHPAFKLRNGKTKGKKSESRVTATYDFTKIRELLDPDSDHHAKTKKKIPSDLYEHVSAGRAIDWTMLEPHLMVSHDAKYRRPKNEHGTHVGGILGGDFRVSDSKGTLDNDLKGICPDIRLWDVRVLDEKGEGDEFSIIAALQFLRFKNQHSDAMAVQGANLSFSILHDVVNYACGRTPVCDEADRLVDSGVVVVAAAGNEGRMQYLTPRAQGASDSFAAISITDPGNTESVITVGATHRYRPHSYGVSYFSSRGPTGDGRCKPDIVAPGEKIKSAVLNDGADSMDGTSMAAPHVSGAAALLMARHRELVADPQRIKEILCKTATDLGRERYFQGAGMVDILRALQSV